MNPLRASENQLSACGRALRPWLWRTLLPAAVLDPSGQASPAERQPCPPSFPRAPRFRDPLRSRRANWKHGQNGRCKVHGGKSTGPRTPEGLERSKRARWKHGYYSREAKVERSRVRAALLALRYLRIMALPARNQV